VRRLPLLATFIVALAVATMIGLGIWQLQRASWKEGLLARYKAAETMPPVAFQPLATDDGLLFRRSSALCLEPVSWTVNPGRNRAGESGWHHIVSCRTGAEGPGVTLDMGWSPQWNDPVRWTGGRVTGMITWKPDHRSLIGEAFDRGGPRGLMIVADTPAPGLRPSAFPSIADIPNNHMAYAVQWFLFAAVAVIIYVLALRRRARRAG